VAGQVRTHDLKTPHHINPMADWVIVPDVHEAVIDRDLVERVQARLEQNRKATTPSPKGGKWLLSGLLICGPCGWRMIDCTQRSNGQRYYKCGRYHAEGKYGCHCNLVQEAKVLRCVMRKLQEALLNPANLDELRDDLRRQVEAQDATRPRELDALRRQLAELEDKLRQGQERLALIPQDLLTDYAAMLRGWRTERDRLADQVKNLDRQTYRRDMEETVKAAEAQLYRLREAVTEGDPCHVRAVVQEMVSNIVLDFYQVPKAQKVSSVCTGGTIHVRTQEGITLPGQRADSSNGDYPTPAGWGETQ
jgi:site-specific DNA recombinase